MASQSDATESTQLIFEPSIDGLLRSMRPLLTPKGISELRALGMDVHGKLQPAYPAEVWARAVKVCAADAFPSLEPFEGQRRVAERTVDAFTEGLLGSAMFQLLRLMGPDRTIVRMTRNLRAGSNFVETRVIQLEPHHYEVWIKDVSGVPGFYMGMLECGLRHVGAKELRLEVSGRDGPSCTYLASWKG